MSPPDYTNDARFDGLYLQIASQTRGIEPLLDTLFSFLRRKSDFFGEGDEKGVERAMDKVNEVLERHRGLFLEEKRKEMEKKKKEAAKKEKPKREDDVIELGEDGGFDISNSIDSSAVVGDNSENASDETKQPASTETSPSDTAPRAESKEKQEQDDTPPPLGNGGTTDKYTWTQTLSELCISLPLPPNTRARDLNVIIGKTTSKYHSNPHPPLPSSTTHSPKPSSLTIPSGPSKTTPSC
ncbi:hypothetical protein HJC23_006619 [Cyclotella cryptica]|uniref:Nuclear migration protein nudC n=1 Tax=Cyclotella cryptica TaxID=29204 RepID=A0ABD3QXM3_9STRA|eukprot:CCRYP_001032-RA/>CCRYP_001032-RA protein AED:0.07 eAED:0.07 QI:60/1/1/1/0/0/2/581/239